MADFGIIYVMLVLQAFRMEVRETSAENSKESLGGQTKVSGLESLQTDPNRPVHAFVRGKLRLQWRP